MEQLRTAIKTYCRGERRKKGDKNVNNCRSRKPGKEYENTRHNEGFMVMDALAEKIGADISEKKHKALCGKGVIGGEKVILMKPQTYMNSSGESIRAAADYYKVDPEDILIGVR